MLIHSPFCVYNRTGKVFLVLFMAAVVWSAFFVYAGAQTRVEAPLTEQESAALKELGETIGQKITTRAEAHAICNEERYLNTCVEIGKKHTLYAPEELEQVDELLTETKGTIINDLEQCRDETCLLEAARRLTEKIAKTKPELAKQFDLTKEKFGEKEKIIEAAKEIGVSFAECKNIDPDTASVELLRGCARLAKDQRVNEGLSEASKEKVKNIDKSIELSEALKTKRIECGDGTVDGCGNFCLNPGPEARAKGVEGIAPVCRQIAEKFYGAEGIKALESAYQEVGKVETYIKSQTENLVFKTLDGEKLYNPAEIGKYLETEGKKGNVEAVKKGMDFLLSNGFITREEKNFALKMVEQIRSRGVEVDFDSCEVNPQACQDVIPDEYRLEFTVMDRIEGIIKIAMQAEGVPDPNFCDDERYGDACLRAAERVLPQIEGIGGNIPEAQAIIAEIKSHIVEGKGVSEARNTTKRRFEGGEMKELSIGGKTFTDFNSLETFCKTNGALCLAEVAKQGIIREDFAAQKFTKSYERQYTGRLGVQSPLGERGHIPPYNIYGPSYRAYDPTYIQGTYVPGYGPYSTQVPSEQRYPITAFDKEEALRQFQKWLDNPQGPAPIPIGPQVTTAPVTVESPRPQYPCPALSYKPCQEGQTRETYKNENGCIMEGECKYTPYPEPPYQTITFPYTFSSDAFVAKTYEDAKRHCYEVGAGTSVEKECREKIGYAGPLIKPVEYPTWISHEWRFSDGGKQVSYIFDKTDREYSDYIQKVESQCRVIPQYKFKWKPNAQDANPTNWQNFGIPDCSGEAVSGDTCVSKYGPGWVTRERTTGNCYDSYSTSFRTSQGTLYSCSAKPATISAPGCTTVTTVPTPSTSTIVTPTYPGDESSCPGFAYSRWDKEGKRYCQLNTMRSCSYSYPAYLTQSNYTPESCPTETPVTYGDCNIKTSSASCSAQPGCVWYGTYCEGNYYQSGNWTSKTWTFSNGTERSSVLSRTDKEYLDYIASVETGCKTTKKESFCWKSGAGNDSDWRNFGIPDCSGTCSYYASSTYSGTGGGCGTNVSSASCYAQQGCAWYGTYCGTSSYSSSSVTGTGTSSSCSASLKALLGTDCHYMYNDTTGKQVYCDGPMSKSAKEGDTATTAGCSSSSYTTGGYSCNYDGICNGSETTAGCPRDCPSGTTTGGTTCGTSTCAPGDYCANSTNSWCCPTGMSICSDGRCVWGASACGSGTGTTTTTTGTTGTTTTSTTGTTTGSCSASLKALLGTDCHYMYNDTTGKQVYCDGPMSKSAKEGDTATTAGCSSSGGTYGSSCPSGQYWNGSACVNTSTTDCPSGQYWNGTSCVSSTTSGSTTCSASLTALLGTGCHYMYNDTTGKQVYCDGPMSKSAKEGDTATTAGCSSGGTYSGTTSGSCTPNEFNGQTTNPACSYSRCPTGCTFNSQGCPSGCIAGGAYVPMTERQLAWACDKGGGDWDGSAGKCERSSFFGSIRNAVKKIFSTLFGRK